MKKVSVERSSAKKDVLGGKKDVLGGKKDVLGGKKDVLGDKNICRLILDFAGPTAELAFCLITGHKVRSWFTPTAFLPWRPLNPSSREDRECKARKINTVRYLNGKGAGVGFFLRQVLKRDWGLTKWYHVLRFRITGIRDDDLPLPIVAIASHRENRGYW